MMPNNQQIRLLPCPFCGESMRIFPSCNWDSEYVMCMSCTTTGPHAETGHDAIAAWNSRASSPLHEVADAAAGRRGSGGSRSERVGHWTGMPSTDESRLHVLTGRPALQEPAPKAVRRSGNERLPVTGS